MWFCYWHTHIVPWKSICPNVLNNKLWLTTFLESRVHFHYPHSCQTCWIKTLLNRTCLTKKSRLNERTSSHNLKKKMTSIRLERIYMALRLQRTTSAIIHKWRKPGTVGFFFRSGQPTKITPRVHWTTCKELQGSLASVMKQCSWFTNKGYLWKRPKVKATAVKNK